MNEITCPVCNGVVEEADAVSVEIPFDTETWLLVNEPSVKMETETNGKVSYSVKPSNSIIEDTIVLYCSTKCAREDLESIAEEIRKEMKKDRERIKKITEDIIPGLVALDKLESE